MYLDIKLECGCIMFAHSSKNKFYPSVIEDIFIDKIEIRPGKMGYCFSHFPNLSKPDKNPST
jgi:hypothetical protein